MSCYRCGARQTDPVRGASPWRKGVRADEQVLICPDCQQNSAWLDELDRCAVCGSTALIRRLGKTVCRDCEAVRLGATPAGRTARPGAAAAEGGTHHVPGSDHDLAREVAAAIDRVLGRVSH